MEKTFILEIVTPIRVVCTEEAVHVKAPGVAGYFGVMHNHAPFLTALKIGVIEVRMPAGMRYYATSGGFCEVMDNRMKLLVETAEASSEIDVARAEAARDRAKERLDRRPADLDLPRAQAALARALNRIDIAQLT